MSEQDEIDRALQTAISNAPVASSTWAKLMAVRDARGRAQDAVKRENAAAIRERRIPWVTATTFDVALATLIASLH